MQVELLPVVGVLEPSLVVHLVAHLPVAWLGLEHFLHGDGATPSASAQTTQAGLGVRKVDGIISRCSNINDSLPFVLHDPGLHFDIDLATWWDHYLLGCTVMFLTGCPCTTAKNAGSNHGAVAWIDVDPLVHSEYKPTALDLMSVLARFKVNCISFCSTVDVMLFPHITKDPH